MIHYLVAFGLLLHVLLWGAGVAMLVMPRPWGRFWPVLVVPVGLGLQSAIVWVGAHAGLRGTNAYAWWSELIPVVLLAVAIRWRGAREVVTEVSRFGVVWAMVGGCLALLVLPVAIASRTLTTISLGSCDAADYAAGARVLMEFAREDREGFMGLTEVVRVQSVDNFFDYWLRLNHFTPSALMALNGTVLGCAPHEVASLLTAVLLAGLLPMVFWMARALIGHSGGVSVIIAGLFGVSPVPWYAVAHVSPGQLLAAQAMALVTWSGVALWRMRLTWRRGWRFAAGLGIGYWLVLGSYNFFVLVCLVPAIAYAGGLAVWRRSWGKFALWIAVMFAPLLACGVVFAGRVAGLAERLSLLQAYDFGWPVPALTAEGWLGMVQGPDLSAWSSFGIRWVLSAGVVGMLAWVFLREAARRQRAVWTVIAMTVPVLVAYLGLQARGATLGTNASYDAYKLFAVFHPLLLPALCWWVTLRCSRRLHEWLLVCGVGLVVITFNVAACGMFIWKMSRPPLQVDDQLPQLRRIEAMADVRSVNMIFSEQDMWSRLWASAFLLRKAQYFQTDTYEARWHTPLRGDWDLEGGLVAMNLPGDGRRQVTPRFALVDTRHPLFLRVLPAEGWHAEEHTPGSAERWQWTRGEAALQVDNPHSYTITLDCVLDSTSPVPRTLALMLLAGEDRPFLTVREERQALAFPALDVPTGASTLVMKSGQPATIVPGDSRPLGVSVFRFQVTPRK